MSKPRQKKEISGKDLLKKIRKPPAPPSQVHGDRKKYKRTRIRLPADENENDG